MAMEIYQQSLAAETYPQSHGRMLCDAAMAAYKVHVSFTVCLRAAVPHWVVGSALHIKVFHVTLILKVVER